MLDVIMLKVKAIVFAHGLGVVVDSRTWHKITGYVNDTKFLGPCFSPLIWQPINHCTLIILIKL